MIRTFDQTEIPPSWADWFNEQLNSKKLIQLEQLDTNLFRVYYRDKDTSEVVNQEVTIPNESLAVTT